MAAKARELDLRGLEMNGDRILKAVATGLTASPEFHPVEGEQLVVLYARRGNQPVFQLVELDPQNWDKGGTCYVQGALAGVRDNRHYFNSNGRDVVRTFDIASTDLCRMIVQHAPA